MSDSKSFHLDKVRLFSLKIKYLEANRSRILFSIKTLKMEISHIISSIEGVSDMVKKVYSNLPEIDLLSNSVGGLKLLSSNAYSKLIYCDYSTLKIKQKEIELDKLKGDLNVLNIEASNLEEQISRLEGIRNNLIALSYSCRDIIERSI